MNAIRPGCKSYEESCRHLQSIRELDQGALPSLPDQRPQSGDDLPHGVRFFRTWVGSGRPFGLQTPPDFTSNTKEDDFENLTLPRTFFGRSEISRISFRNTDLSESTLCWNDFIEVNFTDADLSSSDLRSARFIRTLFVRADLRSTDLRRSTFKECDFSGANLAGAKMTHQQGEVLPLTEEQRREIDWQGDSGEEPLGG